MDKGPKGAGKAGRKAKASSPRRAAGKAPAQAPPEAALGSLARKSGNDGVKAALADTGKKRDALLQFVAARLGAMKAAQSAEKQAEAGRRQWFDEVARGKTGFGLPDPSRWGEPARMYKRAIEALCAGDLGRGVDLVRQAHAAEERAFAGVPVQVDLPDEMKDAGTLPEEATSGSDGEGCPRTARPELLAEADAIARVAQGARAVTLPPARTHRGWWDIEEAPDDGKPASGAKPKAEPATAEAAQAEREQPAREEAVEETLETRARARVPVTQEPPLVAEPAVRDVTVEAAALKRLARRRASEPS
jgi:hypothetical protein